MSLAKTGSKKGTQKGEALRSIPEGLPAPGEPLAKDYTKPGFTPDNPVDYAHMMLERIQFDTSTGQRLSEPFSNTFNRGEWTLFLKFQASQGLDVVEILHLPAGWRMPEINII